ncbi:uncharacterized protein [Dysidea avara]|uniref:uncharacterized protein isoform X3 n=1 Tax=Dysidea avara TaxID=196820 RepID=UPI003317A073
MAEGGPLYTDREKLQLDDVPTELWVTRYGVRDGVCAAGNIKWKDLGHELLDREYHKELGIIETNHPFDVRARFSKMFNKWIQTTARASWRQLIKALFNIGLTALAKDVEQRLLPVRHDRDCLVVPEFPKSQPHQPDIVSTTTPPDDVSSDSTTTETSVHHVEEETGEWAPTEETGDTQLVTSYHLPLQSQKGEQNIAIQQEATSPREKTSEIVIPSSGYFTASTGPSGSVPTPLMDHESSYSTKTETSSRHMEEEASTGECAPTEKMGVTLLPYTKANVWSESRNMELIGGPFLISCDGQTGRYFVWREHGLQLYLPANCARKRILVTVSSYIPFKSQPSPGVHIVSSIYHLRTNIKQFSNFVTLHLQHCVKLKSEEDCQKMCFIIHNKDGKTTVDGKFHIGHSYGTIEVTKFCYIYIAWEAERGINIRPLNDQQEDGVQEDANSGPLNNGSSEEPSHPSSAGGQQNSSNGDHGNDGLMLKPSTSMESNKSLAEEAGPTYVYEDMLAVPSNRLSITNKSWNGIYSIYRNLEGWRSFSIEVMVKEKQFNCPIDILTSEVEFDGGVATLTCNNLSSDSWVVDCIPFEVKKSVVDQEYFQFKETDDPNYSRHHSHRMVHKSLIYVTKKIHSECIPLNCHLIIKGVHPPQDIDLLAGSQDCMTLYKSSYSMQRAQVNMCDYENGNELLEKEPKMKHLIQFVIPKIKPLWEDVAYVLLYDIEEVESIKTHPQNDVKSCCNRLLIDWLSTSHGAHPKTWSTLIENLKSLEDLRAVVDDVEKKLQHPTVIADYQ